VALFRLSTGLLTLPGPLDISHGKGAVLDFAGAKRTALDLPGV
jgi:hypothetical protein